MNSYPETCIPKLNMLLENNYKAESDYNKAAKKAKSKVLSFYFETRAAERRKFAEEINSAMTIAGENPIYPSVSEERHSIWRILEKYFSDNEDEIMLEEALRRDRIALKEYQYLLRTPLPPEIRTIVKKQMLKLEITNDLITSIEDIKIRK